MMVKTEVFDALAGVRQGLQADGADLEIDSVEDDVATVRLLFSAETCQECIVPAGVLERLMMAAFRGVDPALQVRLLDPRDGGGGVQT